MKIQEFVEIVEDKLQEYQLNEAEQKLILRRLTFPFVVGDKENLNKRTYPSEVLKREVNKMNQKIKDSKLAGCLEHPSDGHSNLGDVSHFIEKLEWIDEEKTGYATASIVNTGKGRDVLNLLKAGLKMGVSMRGYGNIKDGIVQDDYNLDSIDLVSSPAFGKAVEISSMNLHESANSMKESNRKRALFEDAISAGYKGTYKEWLEKVFRRLDG